MAYQAAPGGLLEPVRQSLRVRRSIEAAFDTRSSYVNGWPGVIASYLEAAGAAEH